MKRILFAVCGLWLGWFCLLGLISLLASDESKLIWMLESMEEGYNQGNVRMAIGRLSDDWLHEGLGYSKQDLRAGLLAEFFQGRDPVTKQLLRRVVLEWEHLELSVRDGTASLVIAGSFERWAGGDWKPKWRARFFAELIDGKEGWQIQKTRHEDLSGTQLSR